MAKKVAVKSTQATSGISFGLAQMKKHWRAEDGEIEECSTALWGSWPVRKALKEFPTDPEAVLATLAGRMFMAGSESTLSTALPDRTVSDVLPVSESNTTPSAAVNALAQAIYALPQGEAEQTACLADQLENITRQPEISPETRSVLAQLVLALLTLKRERLAYELKENTEALLGQLPQDEIDREVEDTLRRSQEEGGPA